MRRCRCRRCCRHRMPIYSKSVCCRVCTGRVGQLLHLRSGTTSPVGPPKAPEAAGSLAPGQGFSTGSLSCAVCVRTFAVGDWCTVDLKGEIMPLVDVQSRSFTVTYVLPPMIAIDSLVVVIVFVCFQNLHVFSQGALLHETSLVQFLVLVLVLFLVLLPLVFLFLFLSVLLCFVDNWLSESRCCESLAWFSTARFDAP